MEDQDGQQSQSASPQSEQSRQQRAVGMQSSPSKPSKKGLLVGLIVALVVLLGGGGAAAFYQIQNNKPEKVLADALANTMGDLVDKKDSTTIGSITLESKESETPYKMRIDFDAKSSGENGQGTAEVTLDFSGKTYTVKTAAVIMGEKEYYVKVENLAKTVDLVMSSFPEIGVYKSFVDPLVAKIDNRWIRITQDDLKQLGVVDEKKFNKCTAALENLKLSNDDRKQLKKLFSENQFIIAGETLSSESIASEVSYHYRLDFNNKAAENFVKQVINMQSFEAVRNDCDVDEKNIENGFKDDKSPKSEDDIKPVVELWVGKKSRRPTKVRLSGDNKEITLDFSAEMKFDAANVVVEKPDSSISITELKAELENLVPKGQPSISNFDTL